MKNWKLIFRLLGILGIGLMLLLIVNQTKYSTSIFDSINSKEYVSELFLIKAYAFRFFVNMGAFFLAWTLLTDVRQFVKKKKLQYLIPLLTGVILAISVYLYLDQIEKNFNKPSLVKAKEFSGVQFWSSIDFKKDGFYIFTTSLGFGQKFEYGSYNIIGNEITINKEDIDGLYKQGLAEYLLTGKFQIRPNRDKKEDNMSYKNCLSQIDANGNIVELEGDFTIIIDNRVK